MVHISDKKQCSDADEAKTHEPKPMISDEVANGLTDIFKALGDPTRLKLIYALLQEELCVQELTDLLGMGQSAVSHQLRYLRNLRLVKRRKEGKSVFYSLDDEHVEQLIQLALNHVKHG